MTTFDPEAKGIPQDARRTKESTDAVVAALMDSVAKRQLIVAEASRIYDQLSREGKVPSFVCDRHNVNLTVDRAETIRRSAGTGKFDWVPVQCGLCVRDSNLLRDEDRMRDADCPSDLFHATFDNWRPSGSSDVETLAVVREYAEKLTGALFLIGSDYGVGKSHLAVAVIRASRRRAWFVTAADFFGMLRATYRDPKAPDPVERAMRVPLLVFDDLGASSGSRDELPALHRVFDHRKTESLPWVTTANVSRLSDLGPVLGARMIDRLKEVLFDCRIISGQSKRKSRV